MEYLKGFKPSVKVSYKHIELDGVIYKRRLRINMFNLMLISKETPKESYRIKVEHKNIPVKNELLKDVCSFLCVEYKDTPTYLFVDQSMCSFSKVP